MKKATIGAALLGLLGATAQDPERAQAPRGTLLSEEIEEALRSLQDATVVRLENDWTRALQGIHEKLQDAEQAQDADAARQALDEIEKAIMEARRVSWKNPEHVGTRFFQVLRAPF